MSKVAKVKFTNYETSVGQALDLIGGASKLPDEGLIIIKPNLTNSQQPPVTTNVGVVEAVYNYCTSHCKAEVAIGEGCGDGVTQDTFDANGYTELSRQYGIRLIDFNKEKTVVVKRRDTLQLKEFHIPEVVRNALVISVPTLKDHDFTVTTISMKNMFGIASAPFYRGKWNKSKLHSPSTHKSVVDVCLYKSPQLCVVDASVTLTGSHLSGTKKKIGLILASFDPVAVDAVGSQLMGHNPRKIEYLTLANGLLGDLENIEIV